MSRYAMDFALRFSVQTDNPDPHAVTSEAIVEALRERIRELLPTHPDNVASQVWPPEIFDYETGTTTVVNETTNQNCLAAAYAGLRVGISLARERDHIRTLSAAVKAMHKLERELTERIGD